MTITTAKQLRPTLLAAAAALLVAGPAQAAWDFKPGVAARLTWSDNPGQRPDGLEESRMIAELAPGFSLTNATPRLQFNMNYGLRLYRYSGAGAPVGTSNHNQSLTATAKANVVDQLLYLDASAGIQQQAVSAFGPQPIGGAYTDNNTSEVRTYSLSPSLMHRFGAFASGQLRLTHDSVDSDHVGMRRSTGDSLRASLASGSSFRRVTWDTSVGRSHLVQQVSARPGSSSGSGVQEEDSTSTNANINLRYVATQQLNVGIFAGYDSFEFAGLGADTKGAAYGASLQWTPSSRTSLNASAGQRFYGPTYSLALQHRSRNTVWTINYNDAVSTSRANFLIPATVDTAAFLDRMFMTQFADPVLRAAAVRAYMQATGLPPALANNINYFSNRFQLQRQFNAAVAMQLARSSLMFAAYKSRMEALSQDTVDSDLLGTSFQNANDKTEQAGASVTLSYKLGPQTSSTLGATTTRSKSLVLARSTNQRIVRLAVTRTFSTRLHGSLELRRSQGSILQGGQRYTENAVAAALTSQF